MTTEIKIIKTVMSRMMTAVANEERERIVMLITITKIMLDVDRIL